MTPRSWIPSLIGMRHVLLASLELSRMVLVSQIFTRGARFENYLVSEGITQPKLVHLSWHKAAVWVKSMLGFAERRWRHHQQYQQKVSSARLLALSAQATQLNPSTMSGKHNQVIAVEGIMNKKLFCTSILLLVVTVCIDISALLHLLDNVTEFIPH